MSSSRRGAFQRHACGAPADSSTYHQLIREIGVGKSSCNRAQLTANNDCRDMQQQGVAKPPQLARMAKLGSHGRHKNNIERDLHRWMRRTRSQRGLQLEPTHVTLTLKKTRGKGAQDVSMLALAPFEVLHALHTVGGKAWARSMLDGSGNVDCVAEYWKTQGRHVWVQQHPAMRSPERMKRTNADAVQTRSMDMREQGKHLVVVQVSSVLSRAPSLQSRFLIALVPSWRIVRGVTMTQM